MFQTQEREGKEEAGILTTSVTPSLGYRIEVRRVRGEKSRPPAPPFLGLRGRPCSLIAEGKYRETRGQPIPPVYTDTANARREKEAGGDKQME